MKQYLATYAGTHISVGKMFNVPNYPYKETRIFSAESNEGAIKIAGEKLEEIIMEMNRRHVNPKIKIDSLYEIKQIQGLLHETHMKSDAD